MLVYQTSELFHLNVDCGFIYELALIFCFYSDLITLHIPADKWTCSFIQVVFGKSRSDGVKVLHFGV